MGRLSSKNLYFQLAVVLFCPESMSYVGIMKTVKLELFFSEKVPLCCFSQFWRKIAGLLCAICPWDKTTNHL